MQTQYLFAQPSTTDTATFSDVPGSKSQRPFSTQSRSIRIINRDIADKSSLLLQIEKQLKAKLHADPSSNKGTMQEQILRVRDDVRRIQKDLHQVVSSGSKTMTLIPG